MTTHAKNKVISGDYKDASVIAVLGNIHIACGSIAPVSLDSGTVKSYEMIADISCDKRIHLSLQLRDGKKSILEVERDICAAIIKNCIAGSAIRCDITPEKIKSCDPENKENCTDCICVKCIVWPKCCYGRMFARRALYGKLSIENQNTY